MTATTLPVEVVDFLPLFDVSRRATAKPVYSEDT
jgi:hypothetical protein